MPTTVNFDTASQNFQAQAVSVWTRAAWSDSWTLRPDLIPLEAQWNLAPETSTATLYRRFGYVQQPGTAIFSNYARETGRGYWVLIEYLADDLSGTNWYWVGYAERPIDSNYRPADAGYGIPESGEQTIPCFGFLKVLEQAYVSSTVHVDPADDAELVRRKTGWIFNRGNLGNRHDAKADITEDSDTSPEAYGFALPTKVDADFWSTRDIVEHLLAFHLPTPGGLAGTIPFTITGLTNLPDWDRPEIETDGRSVADILDELVSVDRLLTYSLDPVGAPGSPPSISSINITVHTTIASALTLPAFSSVPANGNLFTVVNTSDPHTEHSVTYDDSDVVDQVIVRGPPEIAVATFRHKDNPDEVDANELENDWTTQEATDYEDGARTGGEYEHPDWATLAQWARREANEIARSNPAMQKVYRRLRLKSDWDGKANQEEVFLQEDEETYVPFLSICQFLETLPLLSGINYEGDPTAVDETNGQDPIPPIACLKNPDSGNLDRFEMFGLKKAAMNLRLPDAIPFSIALHLNNDHGLKIDIVPDGVPNHAIAGTGYIGNVADVDQERTFGGHHYNTVAATLAIQGDRRPYWAIPEAASVSGLDVVRRVIIDMDHPSMESVHIAAGTIVGFDSDGTPLTSTGGVLRDPLPIIKSLCTMYSTFYLNSRRRVEIRTHRKPIAFQVGGIITTITNHGTVDAVIRSVMVSTPLRATGRPQTTILAASEYFDPMQILSPGAGRKAEKVDRLPNKRDKKIARRTASRERYFDRRAEKIFGIKIPGA